MMKIEVQRKKTRISSLPMYDWPELQDDNDAFWSTIKAALILEGVDAPERLSRGDDDAAFWTAPDLLLGQTCGYPLATALKGKVQYVTTPVYSVEGCEGPRYSSAIVVRNDSDLELSSLADCTFTYNSKVSLSGYRAIRSKFGEPEAFFAKSIKSGGHRNSARMISIGKADVAAIDAVCWDMLQKFETETINKLRVVGWTFKTSLFANDYIVKHKR